MEKYRKYFARAIKKTYPDKADFLIDEIDNNFKIISIDTSFALSSANPLDKRLDFSAYFLALVKTLDRQGEAFESIRRICLEIVIEYIRPKSKFQLLLKKLPVQFANTWLADVFLKVFNKKVSRKAHSDGFVANIITDKTETYGFGYGFDIVECGICKLFKKHHYEKYSTILCEVDEITSGLIGLKLIRTGTIALGAKKCDFRFKKINS